MRLLQCGLRYSAACCYYSTACFCYSFTKVKAFLQCNLVTVQLLVQCDVLQRIVYYIVVLLQFLVQCSCDIAVLFSLPWVVYQSAAFTVKFCLFYYEI